MRLERKLTEAGRDAYAALAFTTTTSEIRNPDGKVVFRLEAVEVPQGWSQVASDVIAQKYFRKAARSSTGWPGPGRTGAGRAATSRPRRMRGPISTRCA